MSASDRDDALRELGRIAMEKRKAVGLSLEDIFERTRVRVEYLRGIENGLYQGFPDLVYLKGFVRAYLSVIGAEELKDEFMSWLNKDNISNGRRLPPANILGSTTLPTKGFKLASHFWLFVVLFLVMAGSGVYAWVSLSNSDHALIIDQSQDLQFEGALLSEGIYPYPYDPYALNAYFPEIVESVIEPEPEPVTPHLHIRADRRVWVRVVINERVVFERTMNPGSEAAWDLTGTATVRYGVANAVTVTLNGQELQHANAAGTYAYYADGTFRRVR